MVRRQTFPPDFRISYSQVGQAVVKGFATSQTPPQQYVAYMLPQQNPPEEGAAPPEEGEVELQWVREYAYDVKREVEGDSYFLVVGKGGWHGIRAWQRGIRTALTGSELACHGKALGPRARPHPYRT